jgi:hypothetical protein
MINNNKIWVSNYIISLLFSFNIFFWGIAYNFIQLRFLIFFLLIPLLINLNKKIFFKILKYALISAVVFLHLYLQSNVFVNASLFFIFGFFLLLIIFDFYQKFFFENIEKIINLFLFFFILFIIFQFILQFKNLGQISSGGICVGCFNSYRMFFLENSHLAYIAPSVIFYLVFIANYRMLNFYLIIFFTAISFMNASLTLYIGFILLVIFTILFKIKSNNFQIFFLFLLTFAVLISFFWSQSARVKLVDFKSTFNLNVADKKYLNIINENRSKNINIEEFNKIRDINKKINLSSEIFRTSIIISKKALYYKPLGYGFNNYNQAFEQFINEVDIYNWETRGLNIKDASNNFSKIVTEFGIFSLFFFYLVISFFFSKKIDNKIKIFLILPIIIQLFIRGSGYFNGGFFLFCFFALSISIKNFKTSFKN